MNHDPKINSVFGALLLSIVVIQFIANTAFFFIFIFSLHFLSFPLTSQELLLDVIFPEVPCVKNELLCHGKQKHVLSSCFWSASNAMNSRWRLLEAWHFVEIQLLVH